MNKVVAWLKSIQLDRILTVFMAGLLLFVSTACSGGASAKTADEVRTEVPGSAVTNEYKGGMNDYSDVDPRQDTTKAQTKAKALVDNAQKNIEEKSVDTTEQYVDNFRSGTPLGERVKRIGEDVGESAKDVTEDVSKGTQKGLENIKENTQDAPRYTKKTAKETANVAPGEAVNKGIKNTQQALDNAADAGESLGDKIQKAAQDAADAIKSSVNKGVENTRDALD